MADKKMAPVCVCGHKASEHHKQMNIRTWCQVGSRKDGLEQQGCSCLMYREKK